MILHHGTIYIFNEIDVNMGKGYKDFGKGFYTTANESHAVRLANRNKYIEMERLKRKKTNRQVEAYLYTYQINVAEMDRFKIMKFNKADADWIKFVLDNRSNSGKSHGFDIVTGPTADDDTAASFNAYRGGAYGDIGSGKALKMLIMNLETDNLPNQVYFGSNPAASLLKRVGVRKL